MFICYFTYFLYKNILDITTLNMNDFKSQSCSPLKELPFTCYSKESLDKIKSNWNLKHPYMMISSDNPFIIWNRLKNILSNVCDNEKCWLRRQFNKYNLDSNLLSYTFSPERPTIWNKNKNEWLDSNNILSVMKQYEKKYHNFRFLGPSPIDFDYLVNDNECVWNELCNFNLLDYLIKGVDKIGIIFNTDPHNKSGEHWISLFINMQDVHPYIFFFDSVGHKIPKQILNFVNKVTMQAKQTNIHLNYIDNHKIQHQKGETECGMYCLYFIIELLSDNKNCSFFLNKVFKIPDNFVEMYRYIYFN
jgi:hypothetical protein